MRMHRLAGLLSFGVLLLPVAAASQPPTLTVLSSNATKAVLEALAPQIESATKRTIVFRFANSADLKTRIEKGEAFDVAVLTRSAIDDLSAQGKLTAHTRADIARAGAGVAMKKGAAAPDISTPDALKRAIVNAKSIAYVGQGATASIVRGIVERFGIADVVKAKTKLVLNAGEAVAAGEAELGFTQISEILPVAGASLVGPLPAELQVYTLFGAAVAANSKEPAAASSLLQFLTSPVAVAVMTAKGMEPPVGAHDRLPPIPEAHMTDAQKKAVADFKALRGVDVSGPFQPLLRSPELMTRTSAMGEYLRYRSALPPRLSEFVILMTAREWTQQYEWNTHYPIALKAGLAAPIAKAIAEGKRPQPLADDEDALYNFCMELLRNNSVGDAAYDRAVSQFGEQGVIDATGLVGYYSMLAMVLNTARTPPGESTAPILKPLPR